MMPGTGPVPARVSAEGLMAQLLAGAYADRDAARQQADGMRAEIDALRKEMSSLAAQVNAETVPPAS